MERIQPGFLGPVAQVIPRVRHFVASSSAMLLIPKKAVWPRGAEGPRSQWEKNTGGAGDRSPQIDGEKIREESSPKCRKKDRVRNCRFFCPRILEKQF